ncbi:MAG: MBL fold metallo-hydrolase [Dehalococcoidia bacterium]
MNRQLIEHQLGGIRLLGYSVAGEETVIAAPELNVCFDVGRAPPEVLSMDHVLLSHGHMDHSAGLAYYFSQRNFMGVAPGCVLLPKALERPVRDLLRVWAQIEGHLSPGRIVGLDPGESFELRRGLLVRTFEPNHKVPALGYCLVEVRRKLKPEFADRTGPELVELKKQGVEIEYTLEIPLVAYGGDTAEGSWLQLDMVRKAKILLLECTFFEAEHVRRARVGYHLHVRDVARLLGKLENEHIVLIHVTRRTGTRDAKQALAKMTNEATMARVTFLMDGRRYRPRQGNAALPGETPMREGGVDGTRRGHR